VASKGTLVSVFSPNRVVAPSVFRTLILIQVATAVALWWLSPFEVLPNPLEVVNGVRTLWFEEGLGTELITSFWVNLQALAWMLAIGLTLSYLTVVPFFRPIAAGISKGRFLSMAGLTLVFTLMFGGGRPLKISLLVFGMTVFFVTSMIDVVASIPKEKFDHARTLGMSEWRAVWEVVVLGTADQAFDILRQNAAIGWMMLTMVEGIVRSDGGVGAMLLSESKHFKLQYVFGIQLVILIVGILQDYTIGVVRQVVCPHAALTLERR
jgi:NitT/TauT family transport system permease protein